MDNKRRFVASLTALAIASLGTASQALAAPPDSAGGAGNPVTLTIGTWNGPGSITGEVVQAYMAQVSELSNGNITLEPSWSIQAAGSEPTSYLTTVVDQVKAGTLDMAVIGSRFLDSAGMTSFDALGAPFLITSDALLDATTASPDITGPMLAGVAQAGLTGLAVFPEALRHFTSFGDPLNSAADFAGTSILTGATAIPDAMIRALGATPSPLGGNDRDDAIRAGTVQGIDTDYVYLTNYNIALMGTTTGNVAPYGETNVLLANPDALARLNATQLQVLRDAAAATLKQLAETNPTEAAAAANYCQLGGRVVVASDADVASIEDALAPVTAQLMKDPVTADLIGRIQALKVGMPDPPQVVPCDGSVPVATPAPGASAAAEPAALLWKASAPASVVPTPSYGNLAVDPSGELWAAEPGNGRFSIFAPDGTFVGTWGSQGSGDGQFILQRANGDGYGAIAFAPDGSFYVLDVGNFRVQRFDKDRQLLGIWGGKGSGPGQYLDPNSIAVDASGTVYVLDDMRDVVETYQPDGTVIGSFDAHPGTNPGFNSVNQMTVDEGKNVYVSDCCSGTNQIEKFDPTGALVQTIGGPGSGAGSFVDQPGSIAVDSQGKVLVQEDNAVKAFAPDGTYLGSLGIRDPRQASVQFAIDGQDNIYVQSGGINEIRKYQLLAPFATH